MPKEKTFTLIMDSPPQYRAFVLRVRTGKQASAAVDCHFTLEDINTRNRFGFYDFAKLVRFLQRYATS